MPARTDLDLAQAVERSMQECEEEDLSLPLPASGASHDQQQEDHGDEEFGSRQWETTRCGVLTEDELWLQTLLIQDATEQEQRKQQLQKEEEQLDIERNEKQKQKTKHPKKKKFKLVWDAIQMFLSKLFKAIGSRGRGGKSTEQVSDKGVVVATWKA